MGAGGVSDFKLANPEDEKNFSFGRSRYFTWRDGGEMIEISEDEYRAREQAAPVVGRVANIDIETGTITVEPATPSGALPESPPGAPDPHSVG